MELMSSIVTSLMEENTKLRNDNRRLKAENWYLQAENEYLKEEDEYLAEVNAYLKDENEYVKEEMSDQKARLEEMDSLKSRLAHQSQQSFIKAHQVLIKTEQTRLLEKEMNNLRRTVKLLNIQLVSIQHKKRNENEKLVKDVKYLESKIARLLPRETEKKELGCQTTFIDEPEPVKCSCKDREPKNVWPCSTQELPTNFIRWNERHFPYRIMKVNYGSK